MNYFTPHFNRILDFYICFLTQRKYRVNTLSNEFSIEFTTQKPIRFVVFISMLLSFFYFCWFIFHLHRFCLFFHCVRERERLHSKNHFLHSYWNVHFITSYTEIIIILYFKLLHYICANTFRCRILCWIWRVLH